ncbi:14-3-3 protein [Trichomonas vaginalis G3]|uniref:14-3-3 protein n=1 Tax=Trichomonas vaginalis (strain ATCC PRA-98 / G3) TaxID=412133 RepID=A2DLD9_TRIV3|nr:protein domain specific binding [Trichomonas vaginalis G3]EAY18757.1 14-3-3 protein [Trichomonas vaginalis G3]KAI5539307.1 protein domain specific binding [Trichomonas vaginalis G3]|eukprot:XP_001579743.1 14-3-3 protein [Trichomonas vaginalis G3]
MFSDFLAKAEIIDVRKFAFDLCDANLFEYARNCLMRLCENDNELTIEDVNAISRICKGKMDEYRKAWKSIYLTEQKERGKGRDDRSTPLLDYRKSIESNISNFSKEIIDMIQKSLINRTTDTSIRGLLYRMIGDYWRYLAEIQRGYERRESTSKANAAYQEAEDLIVACCGPAAAIRLSLMLNMAIFRFEIYSEPDEALKIAQKAYNEGIASVDSLHDEQYMDSILLLQMLHRTIVSWQQNK